MNEDIPHNLTVVHWLIQLQQITMGNVNQNIIRYYHNIDL